MFLRADAYSNPGGTIWKQDLKYPGPGGHMMNFLGREWRNKCKRNAGPRGADKVKSENELKDTHQAVGIPPKFSSRQP